MLFQTVKSTWGLVPRIVHMLRTSLLPCWRSKTSLGAGSATHFWYSQQSATEQNRKKRLRLSASISMRGQVLYRAAQGSAREQRHSITQCCQEVCLDRCTSPVCSLPKSQGTRATGHLGLGQGKPAGSGLSVAVTPAHHRGSVMHGKLAWQADCMGRTGGEVGGGVGESAEFCS